MKVLASPENKLNFTEKDLSQLIGLYHIGIINASDDPVLTAIVLDAINKQNEKKQIKTKLTLKQKILKYFIITILLMIGLSIPLTLYFLTREKKFIDENFYSNNNEGSDEVAKINDENQCFELFSNETYCHSCTKLTGQDFVTTIALIQITKIVNGHNLTSVYTDFCYGVFIDINTILTSAECIKTNSYNNQTTIEFKYNIYASFDPNTLYYLVQEKIKIPDTYIEINEISVTNLNGLKSEGDEEQKFGVLRVKVRHKYLAQKLTFSCFALKMFANKNSSVYDISVSENEVSAVEFPKNEDIKLSCYTKTSNIFCNGIGKYCGLNGSPLFIKYPNKSNTFYLYGIETIKKECTKE